MTVIPVINEFVEFHRDIRSTFIDILGLEIEAICEFPQYRIYIYNKRLKVKWLLWDIGWGEDAAFWNKTLQTTILELRKKYLREPRPNEGLVYPEQEESPGFAFYDTHQKVYYLLEFRFYEFLLNHVDLWGYNDSVKHFFDQIEQACQVFEKDQSQTKIKVKFKFHHTLRLQIKDVLLPSLHNVFEFKSHNQISWIQYTKVNRFHAPSSVLFLHDKIVKMKEVKLSNLPIWKHFREHFINYKTLNKNEQTWNTFKNQSMLFFSVLTDVADALGITPLTLYSSYYKSKSLIETYIISVHWGSLYIALYDWLRYSKPRQEYAELIDNSVNLQLSEHQKENIIKEKISALNKLLGQKHSNVNHEEKFNSLNIPQEVQNEILHLQEKIENAGSLTDTAQLQGIIDLLYKIPYTNQSTDFDFDLLKQNLDKEIYGIENAKNAILINLHLRYIASDVSNDSITKNLIPIKTPLFIGAPGTAKTVSAKIIADSLNREFHRINVGSIDDVSTLTGHRRTYVGSTAGKIIDILSKCKYNNPVILLDEIDKISKHTRGSVLSVLLCLLDPSQNHEWFDNYTNCHFDLSNVLFIATANNEDDLPAPLFDRMAPIYFPALSLQNKVRIIEVIYYPKWQTMFNLQPFNKELIQKIILHTVVAEGMRSTLDILSSLFSYCAIKNIDYTGMPFNQLLLLPPLYKHHYSVKRYGHLLPCGTINHPGEIYVAYVTGPVGSIEKVCTWVRKINTHVTDFDKKDLDLEKGSITFYNPLNEDTTTALKIIKKVILQIYPNFFKKYDLHYNAYNSAIPVHGNSAGIAHLIGLYLLLKDVKWPHNLCCTGAVNIDCTVAGIGGVKIKVEAAVDRQFQYMIIPEANRLDIITDLQDFPEFQLLLDKIHIIYVSTIYDVINSVNKVINLNTFIQPILKLTY